MPRKTSHIVKSLILTIVAMLLFAFSSYAAVSGYLVYGSVGLLITAILIALVDDISLAQKSIIMVCCVGLVFILALIPLFKLGIEASA